MKLNQNESKEEKKAKRKRFSFFIRGNYFKDYTPVVLEQVELRLREALVCDVDRELERAHADFSSTTAPATADTGLLQKADSSGQEICLPSGCMPRRT